MLLQFKQLSLSAQQKVSLEFPKIETQSTGHTINKIKMILKGENSEVSNYILQNINRLSILLHIKGHGRTCIWHWYRVVRSCLELNPGDVQDFTSVNENLIMIDGKINIDLKLADLEEWSEKMEALWQKRKAAVQQYSHVTATPKSALVQCGDGSMGISVEAECLTLTFILPYGPKKGTPVSLRLETKEGNGRIAPNQAFRLYEPLCSVNRFETIVNESISAIKQNPNFKDILDQAVGLGLHFDEMRNQFQVHLEKLENQYHRSKLMEKLGEKYCRLIQQSLYRVLSCLFSNQDRSLTPIFLTVGEAVLNMPHDNLYKAIATYLLSINGLGLSDEDKPLYFLALAKHFDQNPSVDFYTHFLNQNLWDCLDLLSGSYEEEILQCFSAVCPINDKWSMTEATESNVLDFANICPNQFGLPNSRAAWRYLCQKRYHIAQAWLEKGGFASHVEEFLSGFSIAEKDIRLSVSAATTLLNESHAFTTRRYPYIRLKLHGDNPHRRGLVKNPLNGIKSLYKVGEVFFEAGSAMKKMPVNLLKPSVARTPPHYVCEAEILCQGFPKETYQKDRDITTFQGVVFERCDFKLFNMYSTLSFQNCLLINCTISPNATVVCRGTIMLSQDRVTFEKDQEYIGNISDLTRIFSTLSPFDIEARFRECPLTHINNSSDYEAILRLYRDKGLPPNFNGAVIRNCTLNDMDFSDARFDGCLLIDAKITRVNFNRSSMVGATLRGCLFENCEFVQSDLSALVCEDSEFKDNIMDGAIIVGALFRRITITGFTNFIHSRGNPTCFTVALPQLTEAQQFIDLLGYIRQLEDNGNFFDHLSSLMDQIITQLFKKQVFLRNAQLRRIFIDQIWPLASAKIKEEFNDWACREMIESSKKGPLYLNAAWLLNLMYYFAKRLNSIDKLSTEKGLKLLVEELSVDLVNFCIFHALVAIKRTRDEREKERLNSSLNILCEKYHSFVKDLADIYDVFIGCEFDGNTTSEWLKTNVIFMAELFINGKHTFVAQVQTMDTYKATMPGFNIPEEMLTPAANLYRSTTIPQNKWEFVSPEMSNDISTQIKLKLDGIYDAVTYPPLEDPVDYIKNKLTDNVISLFCMAACLLATKELKKARSKFYDLAEFFFKPLSYDNFTGALNTLKARHGSEKAEEMLRQLSEQLLNKKDLFEVRKLDQLKAGHHPLVRQIERLGDAHELVLKQVEAILRDDAVNLLDVDEFMPNHVVDVLALEADRERNPRLYHEDNIVIEAGSLFVFMIELALCQVCESVTYTCEMATPSPIIGNIHHQVLKTVTFEAPRLRGDIASEFIKKTSKECTSKPKALCLLLFTKAITVISASSSDHLGSGASTPFAIRKWGWILLDLAYERLMEEAPEVAREIEGWIINARNVLLGSISGNTASCTGILTQALATSVIPRIVRQSTLSTPNAIKLISSVYPKKWPLHTLTAYLREI